MSSAPWHMTMKVRPNGMPKPANMKLFTPVDEPQRPPTWQDMRMPKERSRPAWTERRHVMRGFLSMRSWMVSPTQMTKPMTSGCVLKTRFTVSYTHLRAHET